MSSIEIRKVDTRDESTSEYILRRSAEWFEVAG